MISDCIYISYNQDFEATSSSIRQVKKTGKYLILSIANLRIDSFYKEHQTITSRQKALKNDIKCRCTLFSLGDKTINSHVSIDYADDNNVNSNMLT